MSGFLTNIVYTMKIGFAIFTGMLLSISVLFAQDPELSQFYASPIYTNPAFAGSSRNIRFAVNGRTQFVNLNNNYRTGIFSADMFIRRINSGIAVMAQNDVAGDGNLTNQQFSFVYSYNVALSREWSMNAGLQGTFVQRNYGFAKLIFPDMIDAILGPVLATSEPNRNETRAFTNFSTGLVVYNSLFYGGVAIHNLFEPNQSFFQQNSDNQAFKLPRRYTVHTGMSIPLNRARYEEDQMILSPNILFMQQSNFYQMNLGCYLKKNKITTGLWFRQTSKNADAVILLLGIKLNKLKVGYSFDYTVSGAQTAAGPSHEISLQYEIKTRERYHAKRYGKPIKCPEF